MNNMKEIEQVLETEGVCVSTTVGTSMYPMLRNRRDTIVVKKAVGRLYLHKKRITLQQT